MKAATRHAGSSSPCSATGRSRSGSTDPPARRRPPSTSRSSRNGCPCGASRLVSGLLAVPMAVRALRPRGPWRLTARRRVRTSLARHSLAIARRGQDAPSRSGIASGSSVLAGRSPSTPRSARAARWNSSRASRASAFASSQACPPDFFPRANVSSSQELRCHRLAASTVAGSPSRRSSSHNSARAICASESWAWTPSTESGSKDLFRMRWSPSLVASMITLLTAFPYLAYVSMRWTSHLTSRSCCHLARSPRACRTYAPATPTTTPTRGSSDCHNGDISGIRSCLWVLTFLRWSSRVQRIAMLYGPAVDTVRRIRLPAALADHARLAGPLRLVDWPPGAAVIVALDDQPCYPHAP